MLSTLAILALAAVVFWLVADDVVSFFRNNPNEPKQRPGKCRWL